MFSLLKHISASTFTKHEELQNWTSEVEFVVLDPNWWQTGFIRSRRDTWFILYTITSIDSMKLFPRMKIVGMGTRFVNDETRMHRQSRTMEYMTCSRISNIYQLQNSQSTRHYGTGLQVLRIVDKMIGCLFVVKGHLVHTPELIQSRASIVGTMPRFVTYETQLARTIQNS